MLMQKLRSKRAPGQKAEFVINHGDSLRLIRGVFHTLRFIETQSKRLLAQDVNSAGKRRQRHGTMKSRWCCDAYKIGLLAIEHPFKVGVRGWNTVIPGSFLGAFGAGAA